MKHTVDYSKLDTPQAVFDHCAEHLLTQKVKSISKTGKCAYRGPILGNDTVAMCGVGCVIDDADYSWDMEGDVGHLLWFIVEQEEEERQGPLDELRRFVQDNHLLLEAIQSIHDHKEPTQWAEQLEMLAYDSNLKFNHGHLA